MLPHPAEGFGYTDFFCTRSTRGFQSSRSGAEREQFPRRRAGWQVWENQGEGRLSEITAYAPLPPQSTEASLPHRDNVVAEPAPNSAMTETYARIVTLLLRPKDKHRAWFLP